MGNALAMIGFDPVQLMTLWANPKVMTRAKFKPGGAILATAPMRVPRHQVKRERCNHQKAGIRDGQDRLGGHDPLVPGPVASGEGMEISVNRMSSGSSKVSFFTR